MNKIKFSHNWNNKLDQKVFTTIRKYTKQKCDYYLKQREKVFQVLLKGEPYGKAKLISVEGEVLSNVPHALLSVDTGKVGEVYKIFEDFGIGITDEIIILTFRRVKTND